MLRSVRIAILLLAGCGRIGFDAIGATAGDGPSDDAVGGDAGIGSGIFLLSGDGVGLTAMLTLDLSTGQLTTIGTISASFGVLGGLATWDANTFYAAGTGNLVEITLSPFGAVEVGTFAGNIAALEQLGAGSLIGVVDTSDSVVVFAPPGPVPAGTQLTIATSGGDLVRANATDWYYFSNAGSPQLYIYSPMSGQAVPIGSPAVGAPFISGMVSDEDGQLWGVSSGSDELIAIDAVTGQLGTRIPLCEACPTPYDLLSGDTAVGL